MLVHEQNNRFFGYIRPSIGEGINHIRIIVRSDYYREYRAADESFVCERIERQKFQFGGVIRFRRPCDQKQRRTANARCKT